MNAKVYYLATCDTCKRILKEIDPNNIIERQEIKSNMYTAQQLDLMKSRTGSYASLLNKRARKLKEVDQSTLSEEGLRQLILSDYTFLKRPVFVTDDVIFVGNSKSVIAEAKVYFEQK